MMQETTGSNHYIVTHFLFIIEGVFIIVHTFQ